MANLLDKKRLYVKLLEIHNEAFRAREEEKVLNRAFYGE